MKLPVRFVGRQHLLLVLLEMRDRCAADTSMPLTTNFASGACRWINVTSRASVWPRSVRLLCRFKIGFAIVSFSFCPHEWDTLATCARLVGPPVVRPTFAGSRSVVHSGAQGRREVGAGHGFRGVIPVDLVEMLEDLGATWCDLAIVHASRAANTEDVAAIHADHGAICWYFGEVGDDLAFGGLGRGEICASRATPRGLVAAKSAFLDATHADRGAPGADRRANRGDLRVRNAYLAAVGADRGEVARSEPRACCERGDRAADRMYTRMYMKRRSVAAERANLASLLDDVERGQVIEISRRGKAIAWLVSSLTPLDSSTAAVRFQARLEAWRSWYGDEGGLEPAFISSLRDRTKDGP